MLADKQSDAGGYVVRGATIVNINELSAPCQGHEQTAFFCP